MDPGEGVNGLRVRDEGLNGNKNGNVWGKGKKDKEEYHRK